MHLPKLVSNVWFLISSKILINFLYGVSCVSHLPLSLCSPFFNSLTFPPHVTQFSHTCRTIRKRKPPRLHDFKSRNQIITETHAMLRFQTLTKRGQTFRNAKNPCNAKTSYRIYASPKRTNEQTERKPIKMQQAKIYDPGVGFQLNSNTPSQTSSLAPHFHSVARSNPSRDK